jgi:hypothetical protein
MRPSCPRGSDDPAGAALKSDEVGTALRGAMVCILLSQKAMCIFRTRWRTGRSRANCFGCSQSRWNEESAGTERGGGAVQKRRSSNEAARAGPLRKGTTERFMKKTASGQKTIVGKIHPDVLFVHGGQDPVSIWSWRCGLHRNGAM